MSVENNNAVAYHTRFVKLSKHTLLVLAVILVAGIIIIPLIRQEDAGIRVAFSSIERSGDPIAPRMVRPRLQGVDGDNYPFMITAEEAIQHTEDHVELSNIKADFMLEGKSWLALNARKADVGMLSKKMRMEGDISIFYDGGYELHTEEAHIDMDNALAHGDVSVTGNGPAGILEAGGFRIYDKGDRVIFTGGVKLTIYVDGGTG